MAAYDVRSTFAHRMPFGADVGEDGTDFRLWAPAAGEVHLLLEPSGESPSLPLRHKGGGWFEIRVSHAGAGTLYSFLVDDGQGERREVPDPASRYQPHDVTGPSMVIDPGEYEWKTPDWRGRPWAEAVFYEVHVGAFTPEGTFRALRDRLDYLEELGITALELMPVADFAGSRNWGYDGVLPFAPDSAYGDPGELKQLIDAAHSRRIMVFLDVVYNHFGPEGNYISAYAPQFFTDRFHTPWGTAVDFGRRAVREFFIHNALYWLEEYRFDGLRLDAVHAIRDESDPHILGELADRVHGRVGNGRRVHLVLENDGNEARYLKRGPGGNPRQYTAQWNDDGHHSLHVAGTGEHGGYYADYIDDPVTHLGRSLAEGFAYQGEPSTFRDGRARGEPSGHLPPSAFVWFLQNHDQVGNRACGERIAALVESEVLAALAAVLLLAPSPPLLFMGEEWGAVQPFLFFCDFGSDLAAEVRDGRRREFARFPEFQDENAQRSIPDPNDPATFARSVLDWESQCEHSHARWLELYRRLLEVRRKEIFPLLGELDRGGTYRRSGQGGLSVEWPARSGGGLRLRANLAAEELPGLRADVMAGGASAAPAGNSPEASPRGRSGCGERLLYATSAKDGETHAAGGLSPWFVAWLSF